MSQWLGLVLVGCDRRDPAPYVAMLDRLFRGRRAQRRRRGGLGVDGGLVSRLGTGRRSLALVASLSLGLVLGACAGDVNPYLSAVDNLKLPSSWHASKTIARGNGGETGCVQIANPMCPSVTRYYSLAGDLPDLYQQARAALIESGFVDIQDTAPNCDLITNVALCSMTAMQDAV